MAIALAQKNTGTTSVALGLNTTAGSLLVVTVYFDISANSGGSDVATLSDSGTNTWAGGFKTGAQASSSGSNCYGQTFYCLNANTSKTFTPALQGGWGYTVRCTDAFEYTGVDSFDLSATGSSYNKANEDIPITTAYTNDLIFSMGLGWAGCTLTGGGAFTAEYTHSSLTYGRMLIQDNLAAPLGSNTVPIAISPTGTANRYGSSIAYAFKNAATVTVTPSLMMTGMGK